MRRLECIKSGLSKEPEESLAASKVEAPYCEYFSSGEAFKNSTRSAVVWMLWGFASKFSKNFACPSNSCQQKLIVCMTRTDLLSK